jgi:hypothetical protein
MQPALLNKLRIIKYTEEEMGRPRNRSIYLHPVNKIGTIGGAVLDLKKKQHLRCPCEDVRNYKFNEII